MIYRLHKLANHQRNTPNALDLLLRSYELSLQTPSTCQLRDLSSSVNYALPLLILNIFLLKLNVPGCVSCCAWSEAITTMPQTHSKCL